MQTKLPLPTWQKPCNTNRKTMSQHNEVGKIGEDLARVYLEKQGYKILEKNYKTKYAEIDLIAEKSKGFFTGKDLVFVEVRTKIGENFGSPEDTLDKRKLYKVLNPNRTVLRLTHHENIIAV